MTDQPFGSEAFAAAAVIGTFETIAEWQVRLSQPFQPPASSQLAADDEDWPGFPASQVVWSGLAAASDHLNAIRRHVEARTLFPSAHLTLCRTALVGASQAVWVLAPSDSATRLARTRTILTESYKRHLQWLQEAQQLADTPHMGTDTVTAVIAQRKAELKTKRDADVQVATLDNTQMVREAATECFKRADLAKEAVLAWRSTSGAAHGFPWSL
ncbi:hypothetical protein ACN27E_07905 [Mycobacterium sp. WMMD1722]|uniref:hypothetical protein n=1 Tax=Mycobacterium sp. WMMD1722 TaxID=3404117 RepID=UPI003BF577CC